MKSLFSRVFWPLFIGSVFFLLAGKTANPSFSVMLLNGATAAILTFGLLYGLTRRNKLSAICVATVFSVLFYVTSVNLTGQHYFFVVWAVLVFVVVLGLVLLANHKFPPASKGGAAKGGAART